jgi:heme oxygenase
MLREKLRDETRMYHERLEQYLAITETVRTIGVYAKLLERFYGFFVPLENKMIKSAGNWRDFGFNIKTRLKAHLIERDLKTLGYSHRQISDLPLCSSLPDLSSSERALGCLYVLEGTTLGGQVLARHFQKVLGISPKTGGAYFSGYGHQTGPMWNSFINFLDQRATQISKFSETIECACETFRCLETWFLKKDKDATQIL